jgi:hypothetical protein
VTTKSHSQKFTALIVALITVTSFVIAGEPASAAPATSQAATETAPLARPVTESELRLDAGQLPAATAIATPPALPLMPAKVQHDAPAPAPVQTSTPAPQKPATQSSTPTGYGCAAAIAYLQAHAEPSYAIACPGNAEGRQAMTCNHHAPECPNSRIIAIAVPCPAAYMNEAHNSWVLLGEASGIDPYGSC